VNPSCARRTWRRSHEVKLVIVVDLTMKISPSPVKLIIDRRIDLGSPIKYLAICVFASARSPQRQHLIALRLDLIWCEDANDEYQ
jgi:hypothetical protein